MTTERNVRGTTPIAISHWTSPKALGYDDFAVKVPSDVPAYGSLYDTLHIAGKTVLDFGCAVGTSSRRLLAAGAGHVTGVDCNVHSIREAKQRYGHDARLRFAHLNDKSWIPKTLFEAAIATFVHPTIGDADTLQLIFNQISSALRPHGRLGLLGLHPNSLAEGPRFGWYRHRLPKGAVYSDGQEFTNEIREPSGKKLDLQDYCWTAGTLAERLGNAGFERIEFVDVPQGLSVRSQGIFRAYLSEVERQFAGIEWLNEWTCPLYQIVVATKGSRACADRH